MDPPPWMVMVIWTLRRCGFELDAAGAGDGRWSLPVVIGDIAEPPSISEEAVTRRQQSNGSLEGDATLKKESGLDRSAGGAAIQESAEDALDTGRGDSANARSRKNGTNGRRSTSNDVEDQNHNDLAGSGVYSFDWMGWWSSKSPSTPSDTPSSPTSSSPATSEPPSLDLGESSAARKSKSSRAAFGSFIADAVEIVMDSVVNITIETGMPRSLSFKITITTSDGRAYTGKVHSLDVLSDLAVVKILRDPREPHEAWKPVKFGTRHYPNVVLTLHKAAART
ncbi:hypothetical protein HDU96_001527 [Phlyctochytrium bullatum]|nr:hypothetical protein HDU96_001527 [Phlyctochytrium bullatum]